MLFTRFERFWHWTQMILIMTLLFTGFGIHGFHDLLDFKSAVTLTNGLFKVAKFYAYGIFRGERHPYRKAYWRKHNPLQALSYLALKLFLFPAIWISGILYLSYDFWAAGTAGGALTWVALIHTAVAFAILIFVIIHIYLLTAGDSFKEHVMPMINGFDKVDLTPEEEDYLEKDEPGHIR
jgi:thiosulfate reductase cytochrome b subunit